MTAKQPGKELKATARGRRIDWRRRAAATVLCMIAALFALSLLPMLPGLPSTTDHTKSQSPSGVQASPRTTFNIEQPVVLSRTPFLELERGRFSLPAGSEALADRRVILEGATLRLDAGRQLEPADLTEALSPLMQQLAGLGLDRVLVRGATIRFSNTAGDTRNRLGPIDAEVELGARGQVNARGVAVFHGDALSFDIMLGRDGADKNADEAAPLSPGQRTVVADIKGENLGEVRFDGLLSNRAGLAGDIDAKLASAAAFMRWLGAPVRQASALRNVALGGRARWLDGMFDLQDARIMLEGQRAATGAMRARFRGDRPMIEGTLAFPTLDLTKLGQAEEAGQPQGASPYRAMLAAITRDLPAFLDLDADMRLSAATILLRNGFRGRGAATVTIDRGALSAELADFEWAGNKGRLLVQAGGPSWRPAYGLRGRIDLLQAQDILTPLLGQTLVVGPATFTLDMQGRGEGPNQLPGLMTGKLAVAPAPTSPPTSLRSTLDPFKIAERTPASRDTPLLQSTAQSVDHFDLKLLLTDKAIRIDPSQIRTSAGTARLSGQIDRSSAALDLLISRTVRPRTPRTAPDGEQTFSISGSWAAPIVARLP